MNLNIGDRVRSKDGGPILFVEGVFSNRRITCAWMDEMGQRHQGAFVLSSLEKLEPFSFAPSQQSSNED